VLLQAPTDLFAGRAALPAGFVNDSEDWKNGNVEGESSAAQPALEMEDS